MDHSCTLVCVLLSFDMQMLMSALMILTTVSSCAIILEALTSACVLKDTFSTIIIYLVKVNPFNINWCWKMFCNGSGADNVVLDYGEQYLL